MFASLKHAWARLRSHFWGSLIFDVAVLLVAFSAVHAWQTRDLPVDQPAPLTELVALGEAGNRNAVLTGKTGIVYFFAPWCRVCRASIGNLDDLVASGQVAWATVVALDYADEGEVREFVDRTGVSLPVLLGDARTAADWSIRGFPTYYVVDASGLIRSRSVGYSTRLGMWVRARVAN
jgi:thiol-disulfide isomerase/thioredoxin